MMDCAFGNDLALSLEPGISAYIEGQIELWIHCETYGSQLLGKGSTGAGHGCHECTFQK